jgi:protein gp37
VHLDAVLRMFRPDGPKKGGCYAEVIAGRFCYPGGPFEGFAVRTKVGARWTGRVAIVEKRLTLPLGWKKPARVFPCSMSACSLPMMAAIDDRLKTSRATGEALQ